MNLFEAIVESSFDAIISRTADGTINSWNAGAERLYGYTTQEAIGRSIRLILPEHMSGEEREVLDALGNGSRLEQFETTRRRKTGELIDVSLTVSPLRDACGRMTGATSIDRDVTRRRKAQLQLQEAIAEAEQANRAKSEFMANISHELRTPMNAILGMTELSLNEELPDVVREYLQTVKDSADTMLILINDILDFSRLEADRFELDPAPFDIRRMLDETMRTLSLRAHEKGLELAASVHPDVPLRMVGDALRLRQMLTNLVGNAIKFTDSGEVVVTVEPVEYDAADESEWSVGDVVKLKFCVADTGIGISDADQQRIFAPFTQADASMTRTHAGTGLGLSICQELAKLQGGRIWVESEQGRGSRFCFTVSLEVAPASSTLERAVSLKVEELAGTRVLVVDDNDTTRGILKEMLESWSMIPTVAESAEVAIRELEAASENGEGFPLLLVDAVMPGTDGIELLERIERSTDSVGASILMLSPADQHLFRHRSARLSIGAFVEKPVSQSGLLNGIQEAVGDVAVVRTPEQTIEPAERRLSILVAEDIAANQKVVSAILRRRGHRVTIAHNGREAIDQHERSRFDAILMDVQMPILDGLQATKAIRELEAETTSNGTPQHIPVVAMTAHAMRGDREACMAAGMDAYIAKPLDAQLLLRTVEQLVQRTHPEDANMETLARRSGIWKLRKPAPPPPDSPETTAAETCDDQLWQPDVALKRMGEDTEILASMIEYFLQDVPELLQQLQKKVANGDATEATRLAHSLKGLCANFEARDTTKLARDIEARCYQGRLSDVGPLLPELSNLIRRLSEALTQWKTEQQHKHP
ncbi:MAG: response regulator [Fuerstiella sp.]